MSTKYHQTEGFKFPAAGLIGLDAGTKASVSRFLRARERELNTIETVFIMCIHGPFDGQSIELQPTGESGAHRSAEFTVGAWRGYYEGSKWISTLEASEPVPVATATQAPRPRIACDLPAKGFDQLRDLLGEMSENPILRETTLKPRARSVCFNYHSTDDFGFEIENKKHFGNYSIEEVYFSKKSKHSKPVIKYAIKQSTGASNALAMDDFGNLFQTHESKTEREIFTEYRPFATYKLGRTSYTIPATIEAVERLAAKILKVKKFCSDKIISLGGQPRPAAATQPAAQVVPMATAPALQPVAVVIDTPPALLPKIETPAKPSFDYAKLLAKALEPREPVSFLTPEQIAWMDQVESLHNRVMAEKTRIQSERIAQLMRDAAPPPATTCNPDALRLRSKATMCRAANRPTWADKLEAQADALERMDPPEPPPGIKPKPAQGCQRDRPRKLRPQRPRKTACILLAKIRHPARQKYGEPFRQNLRQPLAERPVSNNPKPTGLNLDAPPGIKPDTPSGNFYQTKPRSIYATPTI